MQWQRTQLICSIETYTYKTSKFLIPKNEEIKYHSTINQYKNNWLWWCNRREHEKNHNPNWIQNPDHPYRILIIERAGSG